MFNIFKKNNQQSTTPVTKRFFSVLLSPNLVQAAMWEADEVVKILGKSTTRPYFNDNDLLVKLDQCLQDLGPEGESVHQTLFHLDSSFIVGNDIDPTRKDLFQKMTEALQLESLGFVANTESVINAKIEIAPELTHQLVIEFTPQKTIYSLYDGKTLVETITQEVEEGFAQQFKSVLVQLAGKLGSDYTVFFETETQTPATAPSEPLVVNLISGQISTEELQMKLDTLPANLPLKAETLGSEILLSYILLPSATIIARSYGWIKPPQPEITDQASVPPEEPVEAKEEMPVLSRQRLAQAQTQAMVASVEPSDLTPITTDKPKKSLSHGAKMGVIIMIAIVILLGLTGGIFWWLVQSGTATVSVTTKHDFITKTLDVTIDPDAKQADYDKLVLPGTVKAGEISVDVHINATGKKNVGEKATGKVEIVNKTDKERKIPAGTELENGVVSFVTKDEITIEAAKEKDDHSGRDFAKKDVDVVAVTMGTAGNIKKGVSLRVGSNVKDDIEAFSKEDFSGGTDKTINVFSQEDYDNAVKLAQDELISAAREQIEEKKGKNYQVPQVDEVEITSMKFDAEVDDEVEEVLLNVQATVPVIAFSQDDFLPVGEATVEKLLPEGYALDGDLVLMSTLDDKKTARSDGQIYVKLDLTQNTVSVIDLDAIKQALLGQSINKVTNILNNYPGVDQYKITWSTQLTPTVTGNLPKDANKLKVVSAEEIGE